MMGHIGNQSASWTGHRTDHLKTAAHTGKFNRNTARLIIAPGGIQTFCLSRLIHDRQYHITVLGKSLLNSLKKFLVHTMGIRS